MTQKSKVNNIILHKNAKLDTFFKQQLYKLKCDINTSIIDCLLKSNKAKMGIASAGALVSSSRVVQIELIHKHLLTPELLGRTAGEDMLVFTADIGTRLYVDKINVEDLIMIESHIRKALVRQNAQAKSRNRTYNKTYNSTTAT